MSDIPLIPKDALAKARDEGSRHVVTAILAMARAAGLGLTALDMRLGPLDADPASGLTFALMLEAAAHQKAGMYARRARAVGITWRQVGEILKPRFWPDEEDAYDLSVKAFEWAAGPADSHWNRTYGPSVTWRCPACGKTITDRGPYEAHPGEQEKGHADACPRFAAAMAAYRAQWKDE